MTTATESLEQISFSVDIADIATVVTSYGSKHLQLTLLLVLSKRWKSFHALFVIPYEASCLNQLLWWIRDPDIIMKIENRRFKTLNFVFRRGHSRNTSFFLRCLNSLLKISLRNMLIVQQILSESRQVKVKLLRQNM